MYRFDDDGTFKPVECGVDQIHKAVEVRLEELLNLLPEDAELEVDYDSDIDVWKAMAYYPDKERAEEIVDNNGNVVVAFRGVPYDIIENILYKTDVWFVG